MMKTDPLGVVLAFALALAALGTAGLFFNYLQMEKKVQPLQVDVLTINRNQAAIQASRMELDSAGLP